MSEPNRNGFKDATAFAIIHGGTAIVKTSIIAFAIAAGILSKGAARGLQRAAANTLSQHKEEAWEIYQKTGSLLDAVNHLIGFDS